MEHFLASCFERRYRSHAVLPEKLSVAEHGDYTGWAVDKREGQGNTKLQMRMVLWQSVSALDLPFCLSLCPSSGALLSTRQLYPGHQFCVCMCVCVLFFSPFYAQLGRHATAAVSICPITDEELMGSTV